MLAALLSHWREMATLALSVLRGIVENDLKMEKVYVYLPQVNCAFSNIFASILRRSPISRQRLIIVYLIATANTGAIQRLYLFQVHYRLCMTVASLCKRGNPSL